MIKKLHSTDSNSYLSQVAFEYNERGWQRHANGSSLFNEELRYESPDAGAKQYNGNISEELYTKTDIGIITVLYSYDKINKLTQSGSSDALSETIAYDLNGNIAKLNRLGNQGANLTYSYAINSNQLQSITNSGASYRNYSSYDGNGNTASDGMARSINYNMINLPRTVSQPNNSASILAAYTYDVQGRKLANNGSDGYWDYDDGVVYNGTTVSAEKLSFIQTDEGRVQQMGTDWHFEYDFKDHLGNTRILFDKDPSAGTARRIQEDEYYSFGLRNSYYNLANNNRFLYNGTEIQTDLTYQYDYGARFYDAAIGRFTTIDRYAEKFRDFTPYHYAKNNPILNIDVNGDSVKLTGSQRNINAYLALLGARTGNTYGVDDKGFLIRTGALSTTTNENVSGELLLTVDDAINSKTNIAMDIVKNDDDVFVDSYKTGKVDVGDLLSLKDNAFVAGEIGHVFSERLATEGVGGYSNQANRDAILGTSDDFTSSQAHQTGLQEEGLIVTSMLGIPYTPRT